MDAARWTTTSSAYGQKCAPKRRRRRPRPARKATPCTGCGAAPVEAVTAAAQHESWGRKWNTCSYSCTRCGKAIEPGVLVDACAKCRCFWHRAC